MSINFFFYSFETINFIRDSALHLLESSYHKEAVFFRQWVFNKRFTGHRHCLWVTSMWSCSSLTRERCLASMGRRGQRKQGQSNTHVCHPLLAPAPLEQSANKAHWNYMYFTPWSLVITSTKRKTETYTLLQTHHTCMDTNIHILIHVSRCTHTQAHNQ